MLLRNLLNKIGPDVKVHVIDDETKKSLSFEDNHWDIPGEILNLLIREIEPFGDSLVVYVIKGDPCSRIGYDSINDDFHETEFDTVDSTELFNLFIQYAAENNFLDKDLTINYIEKDVVKD